MKTILVLASCLALAAAAQAQVITIDQAKALAGNVTPGDTPGFPITISRPGSYRLMGHLTVSDANAAGIVVTTSRVTLDLNGFTLSGPRCGPQRCQVGQGNDLSQGVRIEAPFVQVLNGTIDAFQGHGVFAIAPHVSLDGLTLRRHGYTGASLQFGSLLENSLLTENQAADLYLGGTAVVRRSRLHSASNLSMPTTVTSLIDGNHFANGVPLGLLRSAGNNICFAQLC
jgi:hypothetical protein